MIINKTVFNKYIDYENREHDLYAFAKYHILLNYLNNFCKIRFQILNVGCGSGEMNYLLSLNSNWVIDGIDSDAEAVKLSQQIVKKYFIKNLCLFNQSLQDYANVNKKYDAVFATDVIEHIENDHQAIEIIYQLLKVGGLFVVSVPALPFLFGFHDEVLGHCRRYTKKTLCKLLITKFKIIQCRYFGFFLIPVSFIISKVLRKPFPVNQKTGTNLLVKNLINIEKMIDPPLGTSLLCICIKK